jgi:hypothetical protein
MKTVECAQTAVPLSQAQRAIVSALVRALVAEIRGSETEQKSSPATVASGARAHGSISDDPAIIHRC